jgi:hypothetical protein
MNKLDKKIDKIYKFILFNILLLWPVWFLVLYVIVNSIRYYF